mgnify:CR=1 FL=1
MRRVQPFTLRQNEVIFALLMILPSFLIISIVDYYPVINGIILSFKDYKIGQQTPSKWIGLLNYKRVFSSSAIWNSLKATLYFSLFVLAGATIIGLSLALLLNRDFKWRSLARTLLAIPWAIPFFVSALLFRWLFDQQYGLVNYILRSLSIVTVSYTHLTLPTN